MIKFTVTGVVPSKANKYGIGRGRMWKDEDVVVYEDNFHFKTLRVPKHTFQKKEGLFVEYMFYLRNMGQYADNVEKTINYLMQKCGIIENDRWIIKHTTTKISDTANPRVEITIERMKP
jgi:Holliday junction resolvase RusA-like endonuclease